MVTWRPTKTRKFSCRALFARRGLLWRDFVAAGSNWVSFSLIPCPIFNMQVIYPNCPLPRRVRWIGAENPAMDTLEVHASGHGPRDF